ncbi:RING-finger domain containing protein [Ophiocordyceps camponoti-floridani]|uniref:RING-finger domain containing protein n=1 Tax=Ophiocordyceps camponoti-floridani TaxID=2030778 RepID=A0A8H4Q110_9HYPO|nr:RING-finger domain containing protein [Ophiocordyceps camponoti-floridani]
MSVRPEKRDYATGEYSINEAFIGGSLNPGSRRLEAQKAALASGPGAAMDPINYLPHGAGPRLPHHGDGHAASWAPSHQTHHRLPPTAPWPTSSTVPTSPLYFGPSVQQQQQEQQQQQQHQHQQHQQQQQQQQQHHHHHPRPPQLGRSLSPSPSFGLGLQGSLPHPDAGLRGAQPQNGDGLVTPARLHSFASIGQAGLVLHPAGFGPPAGFGSQPPTLGPGRGDASSGELPIFPLSDRLPNPYVPRNLSGEPYSLAYPRRSGSVASVSAGPRFLQPAAAVSGNAAPVASTTSTRNTSALPSPITDRRRQGLSRARRYLTSRHSAPDAVQDNAVMADVADGRLSRHPGHNLSDHLNYVIPDDAALRQLQLARGAIPSKLIASNVALQSLQVVDVKSLSANERMCVICYNDYGVQSIEGVVEAPLRLPNCKHVFGNQCIKKWLEDSDSCPYCRDKLPSEPKVGQTTAAGHAFMTLLRRRDSQANPEGYYRRMLSRFRSGELVELGLRHGRAAERRSPPADAAGDDQRRTRQRRASPTPPNHGPASGPIPGMAHAREH